MGKTLIHHQADAGAVQHLEFRRIGPIVMQEALSGGPVLVAPGSAQRSPP